MKMIKLNGEYKLYAYKKEKAPMRPQDITGESISAIVPGNVEIDLMNAGMLPNIYQADNVERTREFELYDWWYVKDFALDTLPKENEAVLVFDGAECSKISNLPIVYAFAKMAQGETDFEKVKCGFAEQYGISWEDFNQIILPNRIDKQPLDVYNPAKYMLYNDYFSGIFDATVAEGVSEKYAEYEKRLGILSIHKEYGYIFDCAAKLCAVLKEKYTLGVDTRAAYQAKDKKKMRTLLPRYERVLSVIEVFYQSFKKQWLTENTDCGLEVQAARIGGLIQRTKDCKERLQQWIDGEITEISQLNDEILDFGGERPNKGKGLAVVYNSYKGNYSVNY